MNLLHRRTMLSVTQKEVQALYDSLLTVNQQAPTLYAPALRKLLKVCARSVKRDGTPGAPVVETVQKDTYRGYPIKEIIMWRKVQGMTLEELGKKFNITRERVRQLLNMWGAGGKIRVKVERDEAEIRALVKAGKTSEEAAAMTGWSMERVRTLAYRQGMKFRQRLDQFKDRDWLYDQYVIQKKSAEEIGRSLDCSYTVVTRWLNEHKIPIRKRGSVKGKVRVYPPQLQNTEWLQKQVDEGKSVRSIAASLSCSYLSVLRAIKRMRKGLPIFSRSPRYPKLYDRVYMLETVRLGKSVMDICKEVGCSANSAMQARRRFGIIGRSDRGSLRVDTPSK